jgi:release factor glutamine methyltransferase
VTVTLGQLIQSATARFRSAGLERPAAEANALVGRSLGLARATLITQADRALDPTTLAQVETLVNRRTEREPFAYLVGEREFYGRAFRTDRRALIPRPETELLVDTALADLRDGPARPLIVDLGTGSGCIAITLALELPRAQIIAIDLSAEALGLAAENIARHAVGDRVQLLQADLLTALRGPFDLLAANLPYVPAETLPDLEPEVRDHEPRLALDGGVGGTKLIQRLIEQASERPIDTLLAELDCRHADELLHLARRTWPTHRCELLPDLAGLPRLLKVQAA